MEISKARKGSDDYLMDCCDYVIGDLVKEKTHLFALSLLPLYIYDIKRSGGYFQYYDLHTLALFVSDIISYCQIAVPYY